ncbi:MAG TPA: hypothetical protein G4O03_08135 [Dehalococcoidia bacterium]|nr:hypothetical protein [Dehalococcoidia bacterium]
MTHTLHRKGTVENLSDDYVLLCIPAKGINEEGSPAKLQEFLRIAWGHNPVNIGSIVLGNMYSAEPETIMANAREVAHAVFVDPQTVAEVLKELKEAELGMSVVVSGLFKAVSECCHKAGLKRHTVNYSLGIWGKTEKLPSEEVLEVTTMCGHGMVSSSLVNFLAEEVKKGRKSAEDAAKEMAKQCVCGIFNPTRAAKLLTAMAAK